MYGRIEGMYTRVQLMSSLAEQKDHTLRLVGKVDELAGGLGDMEVRIVLLHPFGGWGAIVLYPPPPFLPQGLIVFIAAIFSVGGPLCYLTPFFGWSDIIAPPPFFAGVLLCCCLLFGWGLLCACSLLGQLDGECHKSVRRAPR